VINLLTDVNRFAESFKMRRHSVVNIVVNLLQRLVHLYQAVPGSKVSETKSGWNIATPPGALCAKALAMALARSLREVM